MQLDFDILVSELSRFIDRTEHLYAPVLLGGAIVFGAAFFLALGALIAWWISTYYGHQYAEMIAREVADPNLKRLIDNTERVLKITAEKLKTARAHNKWLTKKNSEYRAQIRGYQKVQSMMEAIGEDTDVPRLLKEA